MSSYFTDLSRLPIHIIDIALVAFVLYRVYMLLSRTRAVQLLFGFGIILILEVVSRKLQLETTSWLINNVTSYLVIGLIILLQPELRRLVGEIGRMPVFQWFSPPTDVPLDEIVEAVKTMAAGKVGSIIAILRDIRPRGIIENAVRIDSSVTPELIETIFFKDSPLHDGAVLIEGSHIIAASCYLPLSPSRQIKKTYGSRHRAALGFSEESDAVIVVTSEETGKITVMLNGEMNIIAPAKLKPFLDELLKKKDIREVVEILRGVPRGSTAQGSPVKQDPEREK